MNYISDKDTVRMHLTRTVTDSSETNPCSSVFVAAPVGNVDPSNVQNLIWSIT